MRRLLISSNERRKMEAKTFEIRDKATFIPALAVRLFPATDQDRYLLSRAGYGRTPGDQGKYIVVTHLSGGRDVCTYDPYKWRSRTLTYAHLWMINNWDVLESGQVIDVEFILGERATPKASEASVHVID